MKNVCALFFMSEFATSEKPFCKLASAKRALVKYFGERNLDPQTAEDGGNYMFLGIVPNEQDLAFITATCTDAALRPIMLALPNGDSLDNAVCNGDMFYLQKAGEYGLKA